MSPTHHAPSAEKVEEESMASAEKDAAAEDDWKEVLTRFTQKRILKKNVKTNNYDEKGTRNSKTNRKIVVVNDLITQRIVAKVNGKVCSFHACQNPPEDWVPSWWTDAVCSMKQGEVAEFQILGKAKEPTKSAQQLIDECKDLVAEKDATKRKETPAEKAKREETERKDREFMEKCKLDREKAAMEDVDDDEGPIVPYSKPSQAFSSSSSKIQPASYHSSSSSSSKNNNVTAEKDLIGKQGPRDKETLIPGLGIVKKDLLSEQDIEKLSPQEIAEREKTLADIEDLEEALMEYVIYQELQEQKQQKETGIKFQSSDMWKKQNGNEGDFPKLEDLMIREEEEEENGDKKDDKILIKKDGHKNWNMNEMKAQKCQRFLQDNNDDIEKAFQALEKLKGSFKPAVPKDKDSKDGDVFRFEILQATKTMDVFGDGTVKIEFLEEGNGTVQPEEMAEVSCQYTIKFDKTKEMIWHTQGTADFIVDDNPLIVGLEILIQRMKEGDRVKAFVAEKWSKGALMPIGNPILKGADIIVDLKLISVKNPPEKWETDGERLVFAQQRKAKGNEMLKEGSHPKAGRRYQEGMNALKDSKREEDLALLTILRLNCAQAYIKQNMMQEVVGLCTAVLATPEGGTNSKAFYRRAVAYRGLEYLQKALEDIEKCITLEPDSALFKKEKNELQHEIKKADKEDKKLYSKILSKVEEENKRAAEEERLKEAEVKAREAYLEKKADEQGKWHRLNKESQQKLREQEKKKRENKEKYIASQAGLADIQEDMVLEDLDYLSGAIKEDEEEDDEEEEKSKAVDHTDSNPAIDPVVGRELTAEEHLAKIRSANDPIKKAQHMVDLPNLAASDLPPLDYEVPKFLRRPKKKDNR